MKYPNYVYLKICTNCIYFFRTLIDFPASDILSYDNAVIIPVWFLIRVCTDVVFLIENSCVKSRINVQNKNTVPIWRQLKSFCNTLKEVQAIQTFAEDMKDF